MIKNLIYLALLLLTFGSGYYLGSSSIKEIRGNVVNLQKDLTTKTQKLEAEVNALRFRLSIDKLRDALEGARINAQQKNFGEANAQIQKAQESVSHALSLATDAQKNGLVPFPPELHSIRNDLLHLDPRVTARITGVEQELVRLFGKS